MDAQTQHIDASLLVRLLGLDGVTRVTLRPGPVVRVEVECATADHARGVAEFVRHGGETGLEVVVGGPPRSLVVPAVLLALAVLGALVGTLAAPVVARLLGR